MSEIAVTEVTTPAAPDATITQGREEKISKILEEQDAQAPAVQPDSAVQSEDPQAPPTEKEPVAAEVDAGYLARVKAREAQAEQAIAEAEKVKRAAQEAKAKALDPKADPVKFLEAHGLSLNDLADALTKGAPAESSEYKLQKEIERINAKLAEREAAEAKATEQREREYVESIVADSKARISKYVDEQGDKYELVKAYGATDLVFDIIEKYAEKHGVAPELDKALAAAEDYLEDRASVALKTKKITGKYISKETQPVASTLTNRISTHAAPVVASSANMTREQRLEAAAALLKHN